jgi:hypothetical protein
MGLACSAKDMVAIEEGSASPPADARGQLRSSMFLAAVLRAGTEQAPVKVRNMSPNGALIESSVTPSAGTKVDLMRGALIARGTVIWSSANRCGVRFSSEVSVKDWLAAPSKVQQQRVDEIVALVKAGGADLGREEGAPYESRSHEQLVDDLGAVVRLMQDLEDDLAASDETMERHGMKLQNLDIAMQMLRAVAGELTPDGSNGPVSVARLEDLRVACAQALGTG